MKDKFRLLAIETSCDETAAAVIDFDIKSMVIKPLSSVVFSQIDIHKKFGGVYPELASREHIKKILPIVEEAARKAQVISDKCLVSSEKSPITNHLSPITDIDAIAVTTGPGLIGSLIVGVEFARGLAMALNKPVIPVNHLEGHIYANFIGVNSKFQITNNKQILNSKNKNSKHVCDLELGACDLPPKIEFPILSLVVSGGHTMLVLMKKHLDYQIIGTTLDDAAGECFDKIARMLGLPYPGGPALEKLARDGNPKAYDFPRAMIKSDNYDFSFSGLKTAVFYKLRSLGLVDSNAEPIRKSKILNLKSIKCDIAASAQKAIIDVLVAKTLRAAADFNVKSILVGGGVSANSQLRAAFTSSSVIPSRAEGSHSGDNFGTFGHHSGANYKIYLSPTELATDNALSIAIAAAYHLQNSDTTSWQNLYADASLRL